MSPRRIRRLFAWRGPTANLHSSAVVLAAKHLRAGWYSVTETLSATAHVVDVLAPSSPTTPRPGPFCGSIVLTEVGVGAQTIGSARFDPEILRAVEAAHGPCLWACSRATYADARGKRGRVAWGARRSDGVLVAGVASLG